MKIPTYEEIRAERAKEWATAQSLAAKSLEKFHAEIASMPDVKNAPDSTRPWGHAGIECGCGSEGFRVTRWTTVNGVRHRAELVCLACQHVETWDWTEKKWLR